MSAQKMNLEDLLEVVPDAVVAVDPAGLTRHVNHHGESLFGYPRDNLDGEPVDHPLTVPPPGRGSRLVEVLYNDSLDRDGTGQVLGVIAAACDITKQVRAQREAAHPRARELDQLAELERFQRLTVGRGLKMIKLRKEIEHLKKSLPPTD